MNLDERIALDADRWRADDETPPFDVAVERATVASERGWGRLWLAAAAAVLIAAAATAFVVFRATDDRQQSADQPYPSSIVYHGQTFVPRAARFDHAVVMAGHPRTVYVLVRQRVGAVQSGCFGVRPIAYTTRQNANEVNVAVVEYVPDTVGGPPCISGGSDRVAVPTRISRPLHGREVLNANQRVNIRQNGPVPATTATIPYLPTPQYVPSGYAAYANLQVFSEDLRRRYVDSHGAYLTITSTRLYSVDPDDMRGGPMGAGVSPPSGPCVTNLYGWLVQVCSDANSGSEALSRATLRRVARSLH